MSQKNKNRFQQLYEAHASLVLFYLRKLNVADDQLDDFVQDVFLRLLNNLEKVDVGKEKSFLVVTARNLVIDRYRKQKHRQTAVDTDQVDVANEALWHSDPQRDYELQVLGQAIDEFCSDERYEAFRMFYREGKSLQEIANALNEPLGTIASRVARQRTQFKQIMRQQEGRFDYLGALS